MKVAFRTDASVEIGLGHISRCLTLADALQEEKVESVFVTYPLDGAVEEKIKSAGFSLLSLPCKRSPDKPSPWEEDLNQTEVVFREKNLSFDWLIVDHYGLDRRWEHGMRAFTKKIMVIDDLANRPHDCDVLLDQNYYERMEGRYKGLVASRTTQFLGPRFVLLRDEFSEARGNMRKRNGRIDRILVNFGGSDSTHETRKTLEAIKLLQPSNIAFDVIAGLLNPQSRELEDLCRRLPQTTFYASVPNIAQRMHEADLAISSGGSSMWERCYLGLAAITIMTAKNQVQTTKAVEKNGSILNLGWHRDVDARMIAGTIQELARQPKRVRGIGLKGLALMEDVRFGSDHDAVKTIAHGAHANA